MSHASLDGGVALDPSLEQGLDSANVTYDAHTILAASWENPLAGLSGGEAARRLGQFGENRLAKKEDELCKKLLHELFLEPMPLVVWAAIGIEVIQCATGEDTAIIDVLVLLLLQFLNVFVGFWEEMSAKKSMDDIQNSLPAQVKVTRDSTDMLVSATLLVPGDVVHLSHGEAIAADIKMLPSNKPVGVDMSSLTGESMAVMVGPGKMIWMGTTLEKGNLSGVVVCTGEKTKVGGMSMMMNADDEVSHFEKVLQQLLLALSTLGGVVITIVFIYVMAGPPKGDFMDVLGFCVVLLIASIPIALKVVCTVTLALGAAELAKDGAIVTKISAIEELAGVTMLCSDKTGTLTEGKMQLTEEWNMSDTAEAQKFDALTDEDKSFYCPGWTFCSYNDLQTATKYSKLDLLHLATLCTEWHAWVEGESKFDAIDTMLLNSPQVSRSELSGKYEFVKDRNNADDYDAFDTATKRTMAHLQAKDPEFAFKFGPRFRIAKGATKVIMQMCLDSGNNHDIKDHYETVIQSYAARGIRAIAVAKSNDAVANENCNATGWHMVGLLTFLDPPRPDSAEVIRKAGTFGVTVKMITGDAQPIAVETCKKLGMGHQIITGHDESKDSGDPPTFEISSIQELMSDKMLGEKYGELCSNTDGFANVLPEHKYLIVETFRQLGHLVAMCGDGVNDAPALKKADVGIAVSGAKASAQNASKIVLTRPGLATIVKAIVISRKIFTRMQNFVIYRVACTEQLLLFFLISSTCYNPHDDYMPSDWLARGQNEDDWEHYFSLPVLAIVTVTLLNDGTIISVAYDNVDASLKPQSWDLKTLYWTSSVIGIIALISSIILLQLGLDGADGDGGLCAFGINALTYGEIQTMMYLKISLSDYGSVFNSRTKSWFWSSQPSWQVLAAAAVAVLAGTILAACWPFRAGMKSIEWSLIGFVWIYTLLWVFVQDAAKVLNYKLLTWLGLIENLGTIDEGNLDGPLTGTESLGTALRVSSEKQIVGGFVDRTDVEKDIDQGQPPRWFTRSPTQRFEEDDPEMQLAAVVTAPPRGRPI